MTSAGVAAVATAVEPAAIEVGTAAEELTPFAARYLSTSGGRLGGTATRQQLYEIARAFVKSDDFVEFAGDGEDAEEFIFGIGPGAKGGTYVDFTAWRPDGSTVRIQTIDTLADGVTPTLRKTQAAARIRAAKGNDLLILIPKVP